LSSSSHVNGGRFFVPDIQKRTFC